MTQFLPDNSIIRLLVARKWRGSVHYRDRSKGQVARKDTDRETHGPRQVNFVN